MRAYSDKETAKENGGGKRLQLKLQENAVGLLEDVKNLFSKKKQNWGENRVNSFRFCSCTKTSVSWLKALS